MQYLVSVIFDQAGLATPDEDAPKPGYGQNQRGNDEGPLFA